jgi:hypothetical protein
MVDAARRLAEPVGRAVAVLQRHARVVEHDATHAADDVDRECRQRLPQPLELRQRVVVDERDDVAGRGADADVARHRQFGTGQVSTRMTPSNSASTSAVWSVDGPLTTMTSKSS